MTSRTYLLKRKSSHAFSAGSYQPPKLRLITRAPFWMAPSIPSMMELSYAPTPCAQSTDPFSPIADAQYANPNPEPNTLEEYMDAFGAILCAIPATWVPCARKSSVESRGPYASLAVSHVEKLATDALSEDR